MNNDATPRKRILVVEDDRALLHLMSFALRTAGYDVFECENGAEGDAEARRRSPDLIVHDIMVPGKTGLKILDDLRKDPQLQTIPVVLITGLTQKSSGSDEYWRAATGAADFLTKPFSVQELITRVGRIFARSARLEEAG